MSNWLIENRREDWRREMSEQLANREQEGGLEERDE